MSSRSKSISSMRTPAASPIAGRISLFSLVVCLVAVLVTIAMFLIFAFRSTVTQPTWGQFLQMAAFACIDLSPYIGFGSLSLRARRSTSSAIVVAIATTVSAALGTWLIADVMLIHVDAFAAFMLIIVPIGQWFIVAVLAVATAVGKAAVWAMRPNHSAPPSDSPKTS